MSITFTKTYINGLLKAKPHCFTDSRGDYIKYYESESFYEVGITEGISEISDIISPKGVIRGLHYQLGISQTKIVHVIKGAVFDVCVDLRQTSDTFGQVYHQVLCANRPEMLVIPAGFAHGFLSMEDSVFSYACIGKYEPKLCGAIRWDDQDLLIPWPIDDVKNVILSDKDKNAISFSHFCLENVNK